MKQIGKYLAITAAGFIYSFHPFVQAQDITIGVVNASRIIQESPQGEQVQAELQKEFSDRRQELIADQEQLQDMQERMEKDAAIMSETEREELQRRIARLQRSMERDQEALQEDFQYQRNQALNDIRKEVVEAIQTVAKQNGYDLVLGQGVVHAGNRINITDQVIEYLRGKDG